MSHLLPADIPHSVLGVGLLKRGRSSTLAQPQAADAASCSCSRVCWVHRGRRGRCGQHLPSQMTAGSDRSPSLSSLQPPYILHMQSSGWTMDVKASNNSTHEAMR